MEGAIGLGIVVAIVVVWYLAEHVFDNAFDAVWAAAARLFRRTPRAKASDGGATGSTGLLMKREDAIDGGDDHV